jgi:cytochrome c553
MKPPLFWGVVAPFLLRRLAPRALLESPLLLAARHPWLALAGLGAALAIGGLALAASGVMPIKASSGHWLLTQWFLQFSKRQSVATHSLRIEAPPLDDEALVARGAGHYDLGCRPCHGSPGRDLPRIPAAMTAKPPDLDETVATWRDPELFYIVKHGIKFTGMPAWPAQQRDDEVWAVVAFLRRLPDLDDEAYRALARGPTGSPPKAQAPPVGDLEPSSEGGATAVSVANVLVDVCARCHGIDGRGRSGHAFPNLTGQAPDYLARALHAYAEDRRHSGIMGPIAAALTHDEREGLAVHFGSQSAVPTTAARDPEAVDRGEEIARTGVAASRVPACADCHGLEEGPRNPAYPRLAGQHATFIAGQLRLLQERKRGGSEYVGLMHSFVDRLTDEQIHDAAAFYASLR